MGFKRRKLCYGMITLCLFVLVFFGCQESPTRPIVYEPGVITMVTSANDLNLLMFGRGEVYIDLGEGWAGYRALLTTHPPSYPLPAFHIHLVALPNRLITIRGHITHFNCDRNELTELDVSGMPSLVVLSCAYNFLSRL